MKSILIFIAFSILACAQTNSENSREKISINNDWKFFKYNSFEEADSLTYDVRPEINQFNSDRPADSKPTESEVIKSNQKMLKPWILPTGNNFIKDKSKHHNRPEGNPGQAFPFVQTDFDDKDWQNINLPHDWAINGPFYEGEKPEVDGGMGRLPSHGVAWYRKKLKFDENDKSKMIYLDVDGAMSYAMVWLNGNLVGGWPYGYNSWRVDLTRYVKFSEENQLSIRLDNPNYSARWYPGGGIYRNVWLTKTNKVHVAQWGTFITTKNISDNRANLDIKINVENNSGSDQTINVETTIFEIKENQKLSDPIKKTNNSEILIFANQNKIINDSLIIENPKLWGPPPKQKPHLYLAVTKIYQSGKIIDEYKTQFGIRILKFDSNSGVYINNDLIKIKGVNQHHDLGALGAAFNKRAAERQLEILTEMGCNAIRMSHNPPAPELLELTDEMGFLVIDEVFDVWQRKKTPHDFHLIFDDWYEQDLRSMLRRDRNHPSIIIWSFGNEVGEQYTDEEGASLGLKLSKIIHEEDPTRPTTSAMNWAKPDMPFSSSMDLISLNYQGQGIRQDPMFEGTERIQTKPLFNDFHSTFPDKVIISSETASAFSSRGIYLFPVTEKISSPVRDNLGGDSKIHQVSSYELYAVDFGSSADKVFKSLAQNPYVAGEFVWTGWDYLGEPTPYYSSRSSYTGIIDLAGFKKDRFYLYKSQWLPEKPMAHILPHWNWPNRIGEITPVHVFTSGDEAELFLNSKSLGKKKKGEYEYRLRWDDIIYEPGELKVVVHKNGNLWAEDIVKTTEQPNKLELTADRKEIYLHEHDLAFLTVSIKDKNNLSVPNADNEVEFEIEGPGEIVATDNGDPTDFTPFSSHKRRTFSGLALVIVKPSEKELGEITVTAKSNGLVLAEEKIKVVER
ncbi:MAG: glycoside hydrolase family 2 protein [Ignavibacteriales bacterium]|nr:glycoside hydrolase family 2 protein [Ignavibacteriales bacterium]